MKHYYQETGFDEPTNKSTLTIEKLRQYKGLENITDEQALNIIQSVTALCQIAGRAVQELSNAV